MVLDLSSRCDFPPNSSLMLTYILESSRDLAIHKKDLH